ncbi:MAG: HYR domain-containing protein [Bacteroidota bacterium]|nr:HYR domain-containing protein [Bacteroidota bacterium]
MQKMYLSRLTLLIVAFLFISTTSILGSNIIVSNTNDAGNGSLRNAVATANPGDVILFNSSLSGDSIVLTTGEIFINKNLTITGLGADKLIISGGYNSRILKIDTGITVIIKKLTLQCGKTTTMTEAGKGAAIYNWGILEIYECYFAYNKASYSGGGIYNKGKITIDKSTFAFNYADNNGGAIVNVSDTIFILNSTISSNKAKLRGGGIYNMSRNSTQIPIVDLIFCTITKNEALKEGGGIANTFVVYSDTSQIILNSSIVAENVCGNYGDDIFRDLSSRCFVVSLGYNLIGNSDSSGILGVTGDILGNSNSIVEPLLGDLTFKGLVIPLHKILCGSPALDSGNPGSSIDEDQRGLARPFFGVNDIGAFESQVNLYFPYIYLGKDVDTCMGEQFNYSAGSVGDSTNWFNGSVLKLADNHNYSFLSGRHDTIVAEVISPAGCPGYDTVFINLVDVIKPVLSTCPSNITLSSTSGSCKNKATWTPPTATDNCNIDTIITTHNPGDSFSAGTTFVIYKAFDNAGNFDSCFFTVKVTDTIRPTISCPGNIIMENNDSDSCGVIVNYSEPIGVDNCSGAVTTRISGLESGAIFPPGTTRVTYLVTDSYGNKDSCSFDVTVNDNIKPTLSCSNDINKNNDKGDCGAVVTYSVPVVNDNCPGAIVTQIEGLGSGSFFPVGKTMEKYFVEDNSGNKDTCSFTITVNDNEKPKINCINNIESCEQIVLFNTPVFTDNCSNSIMEIKAGMSSGSKFPIGTTKELFIVTDSTGNVDSCEFDIIVYPTPTIDLVNDTTIYFGDSLHLEPIVTNGETYEWTPSTWLTDAYIRNPVSSAEESITYYFYVLSDHACSTNDTINVKVIYEFIIPTGFTPNNDGENDYWDIKGIKKYPDSDVEIYDRWGTKVFSSKGYLEKWDGTFKAKDLPINSYYYIINKNDGTEPLKGTVTIIR